MRAHQDGRQGQTALGPRWDTITARWLDYSAVTSLQLSNVLLKEGPLTDLQDHSGTEQLYRKGPSPILRCGLSESAETIHHKHNHLPRLMPSWHIHSYEAYPPYEPRFKGYLNLSLESLRVTVFKQGLDISSPQRPGTYSVEGRRKEVLPTPCYACYALRLGKSSTGQRTFPSTMGARTQAQKLSNQEQQVVQHGYTCLYSDSGVAQTP